MYSESEQKLQRLKKSELKAEWKKLKLVIRYIFTSLALRILVIIVAAMLVNLYIEKVNDWRREDMQEELEMDRLR